MILSALLSARKFANMKDEEEIFQTNLERCSYRFLQQTAKAMGLPSNVKKVYLIQLINTKNYGTPSDLNSLVLHIREEQHQHALVRKKVPKIRKRKNEQQSPEISSTSNGQSPPITKTPKRVNHFVIQYNSSLNSPIKYPQTLTSRRIPVSSSDRVLRSSNRLTKPSYLLNNTLMSLLKGSDLDERNETKVKIISTEENKRKAGRIYAKQIIQSLKDEGTLVPVPRSANVSPPLGKPQRRLSGVYPLQPEDIRLPSVAVRRADGSISKLKAIIQKPLSNFNDRQTQMDNTNRSLLKNCSTTTSVMALQSYRSSNISENNSSLNYRPSINDLSSNFTFRSSNGSDMTSSFFSRQSTTPNIDTTSVMALQSYRSSNISENNSSLNYRPSINDLSSNFTFRSSNASDMTPSFFSKPPTTPNIVVRSPNVSENAQNLAYRSCNVTITELSSNYSFLPTNSSTQGLQYNLNSSSSCDETTLSIISKENNSADGEYYHKKIRAEQVRCLRRSRETGKSIDNEAGETRLPKINEVFSRFGGVYNEDVTQPLYVQVHNEPEIATSYIPDPRVQYQGSSSLEMIYNLKMQHQPTLQISTTTNTRTVYCTPVISTAMAQPSTAVHNRFNVASPPREGQPFFTNDDEVHVRANDLFSKFHYHERGNKGVDFQRSCSSVETVTSQEQELGANVTIPEMVEDALELISQDGDYMERMGMDIRMQCFLCNWAGPKIILEYHIRKDHSSEIVECSSDEFSASYSLGELAARRVWLSHVLQHDGALYVLSAKYEDPDYFMATLSTISYDPDDPKTGSMTIYNKVTGEPLTWTGVVTDLPPCMPYENNPNCFKLQLSQMDLLPNSANLKLLNRELVIRSPTKVVVGQPELDSILITLSMKIFK